MFLFLHTFALTLGLLFGFPGGSGYSSFSGGGAAVGMPADGGGTMPGKGIAPGDGGGTMPGAGNGGGPGQ